MLRNNKILGISLLLFGLFYLMKVLGWIEFSDQILFGATFILYGFLSVIVNLGSAQKGLLFLGTILFLIGLLFILGETYQIVQKDNLFITVFLFLLGAGFMLLFVDNSKEKQFLYISCICFISSFSSKIFIDALGNFSLLANFGIILLGYWPVFLVLMGLAILVSRQR